MPKKLKSKKSAYSWPKYSIEVLRIVRLVLETLSE